MGIRFMHLVLFSHGREYEQMKELSSVFYKTQSIRTIYYRFSNDIDADHVLHGDVLTFKGDESFVPGILTKTIRALQHFEPEFGQYDYIVRSNVSTIVNFQLLATLLATQPFDYGSGMLLRMGWLDFQSGITDGTYMGTVFGSGTSIILSTTLVKRMLQSKHHIPMGVIDDVSIGVWVQRTDPSIVPQCLSAYFYSTRVQEPIDELDVANLVFYRHRCAENRQEDVRNMQMLIERLST